jgi:hypothetical protein
MIKKMLWLVILVLVTACSVYIMDGGLVIIDPTPTTEPTLCAECTVVPTSVETTQPPLEETPTVEVTLTEAPTDMPIETATPEITETVTETVLPTDEPDATATDLPTATATNQPIATATLLPTSTQTPTATFTVVPSATATATFTPTTLPATFEVQTGSPVYLTNFANTGSGCNWSGVAGQVFDGNGNPLLYYIVKVTGTYNGAALDKVGVTGMAAGKPYGPGSFQIFFSSKAVDSTNALSIQLLDPDGKALTEPYFFNTYSACSKNLAIINFTQK